MPSKKTNRLHVNGTRPNDGRTVTQVYVDGTLLDVEASFCYLGDVLSAGGGCSLAIITRCCTAWGKFKKLQAHIPHSSWEVV